MNSLRKSPWQSLMQLQDEMNQLLHGRVPVRKEDDSTVETSDWIPMVDIKEETNKFVLVADVPGVEPDNIEVSVDDGILTIKGHKESESNKEEKNYTRVERFSGSFYRRFSLPDTADLEKIVAKQKHGVLEVSIPKKEHSQSRKINIETHS